MQKKLRRGLPASSALVMGREFSHHHLHYTRLIAGLFPYSPLPAESPPHDCPENPEKNETRKGWLKKSFPSSQTKRCGQERAPSRFLLRSHRREPRRSSDICRERNDPHRNSRVKKNPLPRFPLLFPLPLPPTSPLPPQLILASLS